VSEIPEIKKKIIMIVDGKYASTTIDSDVAKLVIEKLKDKYNLKYIERYWKGVYVNDIEVIRKNDGKTIAWLYWFENYNRKLGRLDWITFVPHDFPPENPISNEEKKELAKIVDELNDRLGVWHPNYTQWHGGE
jgi:hypothetical protein